MSDMSATRGVAQPWLASYPPAVDGTTPIVGKPVYALLDDTAALHPNNDCIDFLDKHYSYAEVKRESDKVAKGLQQIGLKPGMRLGLFLPNCPYFVIFYHGALKAGACPRQLQPALCRARDRAPDRRCRGRFHGDPRRHPTCCPSSMPCSPSHACQIGHRLPDGAPAALPQEPGLSASSCAPPMRSMRIDSRHIAYKDLIHNDGSYAADRDRPTQRPLRCCNIPAARRVCPRAPCSATPMSTSNADPIEALVLYRGFSRRRRPSACCRCSMPSP
jgi:hypothetical protein